MKKELGREYHQKSPEYQFLLELIQLAHPHATEKIGPGIKYFYVEDAGRGCTRFAFERVDGSDDIFSYIKCKDYFGRDRDEVVATDAWKNLLSACRTAIADQLSAYYYAHEHICADCGVTKDIQVDHKNKNFVDILLEFDAPRNDTPREFDDLPVEETDGFRGTHLFKIRDVEYMVAFQEYHRQVAVLQLLCRPCNLKKSRQAGIRKGVRREVSGA